MSTGYGTCPLGGLWYTCTAQTPTFLGCCTSNPCDGIGCPSENLRAAGMGTRGGPDPSSNYLSYWPNVHCSQGLWYTCALQTPSFQGCCHSNPCGGAGCPLEDLSPAAFISAPSSSQSGSTATTSTEIPTSISTLGDQNPHPTHSDIPVIAGTVAGSVAILMLIAVVFCLYSRCKGRYTPLSASDREATETSQNIASGTSAFGTTSKVQLHVEDNLSECPKYPHVSPLTSPGLPSYQSPRTDTHEIGIGGSFTAHEVGNGQSQINSSSELDSNPIHEMLLHDNSSRYSGLID